MLSEMLPCRQLEIYISKKYVLTDPTVRYLAYAQRPFRWRDSLAAFRPSFAVTPGIEGAMFELGAVKVQLPPPVRFA